MGGLIADYRASGAWSRDLHVDRCAWTDTMKPRFVSRGHRLFHGPLAQLWRPAKLPVGWTRKYRLWKVVRIPTGVTSPESTGLVGTPDLYLDLIITQTMTPANSESPNLPHTPPTAVWACVTVYVDCVHDDDGTQSDSVMTHWRSQGWGVLSKFLPSRHSSSFSEIQKYPFTTEYHVHIWQVSGIFYHRLCCVNHYTLTAKILVATITKY